MILKVQLVILDKMRPEVKIKMKKVAIVISGFGPGGAENSIVNLLPEFAAEHKVTLFLLQSLKHEIEIPKLKNCNVVRLEAHGLLDVRALHKLRAELKDHELTIAHLLWAQIWSALIQIRKSQKLIWVEHNMYLNRSRAWWFILRLLGKAPHTIVSVSEEVSSFFYRKTGIITKVVHNAIVVPYLEPPPQKHPFDREKLRVAFYGRISGQKDPLFAASIFKELNQKQSSRFNFEVEIIGSGPMETVMRKELEMVEHVSFVGLLPREKALQRLAGLDIYMNTSLFEGFCLARFEALSLGLCVVNTKTAGYQFLLDQVGSDSDLNDLGIYFLSREQDKFIETLEELKNPKYWSKQMVENRKSLVSSLSPDTIYQKYMKI